MINQKQILTEWEKAGLKINGFTHDDINEIYDHLAHNADDEIEANKMFILAIRKAAMNGATTQWAVSNNVNQWIQAGLTNADSVGKYEQEAQNMRSSGRYGQPVKNETGINEPTNDQVQRQNEKLAKQLGYDTVETMIKDSWEKLYELRRTREERMANKAKTGLTANGNKVLQRF
ncbi:hypothetical protein KGP39_05565 [Weissella hellenica]|nr:hypothetical protein [Weissella hellenica]QDJ58099.1 hypothetical protein EFA59_00540 [Weissella hellenica]